MTGMTDADLEKALEDHRRQLAEEHYRSMSGEPETTPSAVLTVWDGVVSDECGYPSDRPDDVIFCDLPKDHDGDHQRTISWPKEES